MILFRSKVIKFESRNGVSTEKERTSKTTIDFYKKEIAIQVKLFFHYTLLEIVCSA